MKQRIVTGATRQLWGCLRVLSAVFYMAGMATSTASAQTAALDSLPINVGHGLTFSIDKKDPPAPLAARGYDVLNYRTDGKPALGSSAHAAYYDGAIYWFKSAKNRETFLSNPARFAPQYGGFCAFGVTQKTKFDGDPKLWTLYNDKLYFNVNPQIQAMFKKNLSGSVAAADGLWPEVKDKQPGQLFQAYLARQKQ